MQSNPINAAQLLMGFLDKEQSKIGNEIVKSGFSEELAAERQNLAQSSTVVLPLSSTALLKGESTEPSTLVKSSELSSETQTCTRSGCAKKTSSAKSLPLASKQSTKARPQVQEELFFTNPVLVEKIMAQLQLPAETRQSLQTAQDQNGNMPLKALISALDQSSIPRQGASSEVRIPTQDVQALLGSLKQTRTRGEGEPVHALDLKKGSYNAKELRELIDQTVTQAGESNQKKSALGSGSHKNSTIKSDAEVEPEQVKRGESMPKGHPERMVEVDLPSFAAQSFEESSWRKRRAGHGGDESAKAMDSLRPGSSALEAQASLQPSIFELNSVAMQSSSREIATAHKAGINPAQDSSPLTADALNTSFQTMQHETPNPEAVEAPAPGAQDNEPVVQNNPKTVGPMQTADRSQSAPSDLASPIAEQARSSHSASAVHTPSGDGAFIKDMSMPEGADIIEVSATGEAQPNSFDSNETVSEKIVSSSSLELGGQSSSQGNMDSSGEKFSFADQGLGNPETNAEPKSDAPSFSLPEATAGHHAPKAPVSQSSPELLFLQDPSWPQDMAERIQELSRNQQVDHITLELNPDELGRITLRVETRENEVITWISTENEHTKELLLKSSPALKQHLEQQGLSLSQFSVDVGHERNRNGQSPQWDFPSRSKAKDTSKIQGKTQPLRAWSIDAPSQKSQEQTVNLIV